MYKDLYKKANENIPSQDAKMRVMAKVQSSKKVKPLFRPIAQASALAACLIFTFATLNIYNNFEKEQEEIPYIKTVSESTPEPLNTEEPVFKSSDTNVNTPAPEKKQVNNVPEKTEKTVASLEVVTEKTTPSPVVSEAPIVTPEKTDIYVNTVSEENAVSPAAFMMERNVGIIKEVSASEYYEYIGKNIENSVKLPEGFAYTGENTAFFEFNDDGTYKNDEWSFLFQKDEMSAEIITTKKTDAVSEIINNSDYQKSTVNENDAVVLKDNDYYKSYLLTEDTGYTVVSIGLSEDEISDLLVSLTE